MPVIPPYLKTGDWIGITCPSSKMDRPVAEFASSVIEGWGYHVRLGSTVGSSFHNYSGSDDVRLKDLQDMLDDPELGAIIFGRGGYGMIRILDRLDFSRFLESPKWICGFSDITALHLHLESCLGIPSLHSLMASGITPETWQNTYVGSLRKVLCGEEYRYSVPAHPFNREGLCQGSLIGGNLSLLANLSGTPTQPDTDGKILLLEDTGEYRYHIDRMLFNLKRAGWIQGLGGMVVGSFTSSKELETPFGKTEYEMIRELVDPYSFPVCFGFPCGHQQENVTLKLGTKHLLQVREPEAILKTNQ